MSGGDLAFYFKSIALDSEVRGSGSLRGILWVFRPRLLTLIFQERSLSRDSLSLEKVIFSSSYPSFLNSV